MATPNIQDFYRRNVPNPLAEPFKQDAEWASGSTPDYTVDPSSGEMILVTAIDIVVPRNLDLNSSDIEIQGYKDGKGGTKLVFSSLQDLKQISDDVKYFDTGETTEEIKVRLKPEPPIKLTDTGAEMIVIHNSSSTTHSFTGFAKFAVHGYFLSEEDY